MIAIYHQITE